LTPAWARTSRSKRARALGPVTSWRTRLPPMPSLRRRGCAVACWRGGGGRGRRASGRWLRGAVRAVGDAVAEGYDGGAVGGGLTSTPLRKGQEKISLGAVEGLGADDVAGRGVAGLVGEPWMERLGMGCAGRKRLMARSEKGGTLRATGSLTTSAPGGMMTEVRPPKVRPAARERGRWCCRRC
jgi:hypothetical protein